MCANVGAIALKSISSHCYFAGAQSDYKVIGFEKPEKFLASIESALGK